MANVYKEKMKYKEADRGDYSGAMGPDSLGIASTAHVKMAPKCDYAMEAMSNGSMNYLAAQDKKQGANAKKLKRTMLKEYDGPL